MRALVTGACGFVGAHLVRLLADRDVEVHGFDRAAPGPNGGDGVTRVDLLDRDRLAAAVAAAAPTHVFHLAGLHGSEDAGRLYETNVLGTVHLLEACAGLKPAPVVLTAGSSAVYGPAGDAPVHEELPLRPATPYAGSKAAQEMVALQYHLSRRLDVIRLRTFNLVGPGQPASLMASAVAMQIARAERMPGSTSIQVGDLSCVRDLVDVRDAVLAYALLADKGRPGEAYNVCSGKARPVRQIVTALVSLARVALEVTVDSARVRKPDIPTQTGDGRKLERLTGWAPRIPFEQSLRDLLEDWRDRCGVENHGKEALS